MNISDVQQMGLPTNITVTIPDAPFYGTTTISPSQRRLERMGSGEDFDLFGTLVSRSSVTSQMNFVRKVCTITLSQLLFVTLLTITLTNSSYWHQQSRYIWWVLLFPAALISIISAWHLWTQYYQLSFISRGVALAIYSLSVSFILSDIVSKTFHAYGLIVFLMTSFGILSIILYTFQKRYKFTGTKPFFCSTALVCISSLGLREVYQLNPMQILLPIAVSSVICSYCILELYYAMDAMTVDDYILANLSFHMDLAYPINCLHHVCELSDHIDNIPEYFDPEASSVLDDD